ncbi:hypothetical protein [Phenylobacterium sp.]|uniref:hypothetical protein n=1 Tax=Phenylobacterium sp. TaxID=1871053 RepID=UPI0025CFD48D|nr:hypothetical protein [Phenylobacterium sp.]MCA6318119.1 hypothetical protein [Phenylobacterium sp.]
MAGIEAVVTRLDDRLFLQLAREIAMDLHPIEHVLKLHGVSDEQWDSIASNPQFQRLLLTEKQDWESAKNTADRVRLKALAMVEEALPEMHARLHDPREGLNHKVELLKAVARFAGVGVTDAGNAGPGERFSVVINLGEDKKVTIAKEVSPPMIEVDAEEIGA